MKLKHVFSSAVAVVLLTAGALTGCQTATYSISQIEGGRIPVTDKYDAAPDSAALAILAPYQHVVDSIMNPVIGHSARQMGRHRPECELSNLVADILRQATKTYGNRVADVAVTNMGGLRSTLSEGEITYGNIYEITPFENYLTLITMTGSELRSLFEDIARVKGEGLSGARLVVSTEGKLLSAEVGGRPIDDSRSYLVSTIDYLSEGNDHLDTFARVPADRKQMFPETTLRGLFLDYVTAKEKAGELVDSKMEGRVIVTEE
jgi:2',3'-cyclic-nucleotide 2'-phosphodiesterase (5'-nucleotidase family)